MTYKQAYRPIGHPNKAASRMIRQHTVIAERALGRPLPVGVEVHHVDENKRNNANGNLVICQDRAYHMLLHVRARVVRAGGNPNTDRLCQKCRRCKPFEAFAVSRADKATGRSKQCRACCSDWHKARRRQSEAL